MQQVRLGRSGLVVTYGFGQSGQLLSAALRGVPREQVVIAGDRLDIGQSGRPRCHRGHP
jgi:hypothetical protein